ncbi:MAG: hypothetical protein JWP75_449 [Frondihabitans sp.]|nr:hypothetical protein [Frondihabitans sp.]
MARPRTSRGLDRLVNFSDATVAIAITLLILPLVDIASKIGNDSIGHLLVENQDALISFFVTFFVIGRFWAAHHSVFEYARSYNSALIRANFAWLCSIAFLPFAANLLTNGISSRPVYAIYIGTMIATTVSLGVVEWIMIHDPELIDPEAAKLSLFQSVLSSVLMSVALLIALLVPHVGMYSLLVLLLTGPITSYWTDRAKRRGAAQQGGE